MFRFLLITLSSRKLLFDTLLISHIALFEKKTSHFYLKIGSTVKDMKNNLAETIGIDCYYIDIVCLEDGIIYENDRNIEGISRPLQVMVGNPVRKIPTYLVTSEPDMILNQDVNDKEPRLKMSCGHAISKTL